LCSGFKPQKNETRTLGNFAIRAHAGKAREDPFLTNPALFDAMTPDLAFEREPSKVRHPSTLSHLSKVNSTFQA